MKRQTVNGVTLAQAAGFCPGVNGAIDCVLELARKRGLPVFTVGPLIHNPQVLEELEREGVKAVKDLSETNGKTGILIIRAHGVTPQFEAEIRSRGLEVVDATCPLVKRAQSLIGRYAALGFTTVIVGDRGHAEVIGLTGYALGKCFVVSGPGEARELPKLDKAHVVSQTTQEEPVFLAAAEAVRLSAGETVISNTICAPTLSRQKETRELASSCDLMIVVGGKNSANTARLAAICGECGSRTMLVETEAELDPAAIKAARNIGVTAGASTPTWMTRRVAERAADIRAGK